MSVQHLVRVGIMAQVGRYSSAESIRFPRGERIIVRTPRGVEIGEVLCPADEEESIPSQGSILRRMTSEDLLLETRLERYRHQAYEECAARVAELKLPVMLMDVEHLFDGHTLLFYFLGEETPELQNILEELAERYDTKVQFSQFAETLEQGCGPGCGTESAEGSGCGSCSSGGCSLASACATKTLSESSSR